MNVNRPAGREALDRDAIDPSMLAGAESRGPGNQALVDLVLRSHPRYRALDSIVAAAGDPGGWPAHDPAELVRLEQKGRQLLDHCLDQASSVCVVGFIEHELGRAVAGRRFVTDFLALLLRDRVAAPAGVRPLLDRMLDEGLELLATALQTG
ncbi:MAG: hypothetical protein H6807_03120 [Planctomycetes bacterium]|nr:hypothetical protein [Planctomycetota bacterium]